MWFVMGGLNLACSNSPGWPATLVTNKSFQITPSTQQTATQLHTDARRFDLASFIPLSFPLSFHSICHCHYFVYVWQQWALHVAMIMTHANRNMDSCIPQLGCYYLRCKYRCSRILITHHIANLLLYTNTIALTITVEYYLPVIIFCIVTKRNFKNIV